MNSIFDLIFRFVPQFYPERIRSIYMLETDLIDKGFLSFNFTGRTCISVKQTYGKIVNELAIRQEKLQKEFAEKKRGMSNILIVQETNRRLLKNVIVSEIVIRKE